MSKALHVTPDDFKTESMRGYEAAREAPPWEREIDWGNLCHEKLSDELQNIAWRVASGSAYVEQIGMLTASRLLIDCDDYSTRLNLARAISDEARHTEAFARYAISVRGETAAPDPGFAPIEEELIEGYAEAPFAFKFLIHTLLEAVAIEEFALFEQIFSASQLGAIYRMVKIDEARHVALGISYLQSEVQSKPSIMPELLNYFDRKRETVIPGNSTCKALERLTSIPADEIKGRFDRRVTRFMDSISK